MAPGCVQSSTLWETKPRCSEKWLDCYWQQPQAYMYHISKGTSARPSDNEEVNERAIGVYMGRNDLRLVVLGSKVSYAASVYSA